MHLLQLILFTAHQIFFSPTSLQFIYALPSLSRLDPFSIHVFWRYAINFHISAIYDSNSVYEAMNDGISSCSKFISFCGDTDVPDIESLIHALSAVSSLSAASIIVGKCLVGSKVF